MIKTSKFVAALTAVFALALAIALSSGWFGEGLDTANYIRIFDEIQLQTSVWDLRYEPLFILVVQFISTPTTQPIWIFFAIIATALLAKIIAVRQINANDLIFLISYFSLWAPTLELNQIRAALALGLFLLIIASRRLGTLGVLSFSPLTLGFHYSMIGPISAIWIYVIVFSKLTRLKKILLLSGIGVLAYFLISFIDSRFSTYLLAVSATMQTEDTRMLSFFSLYVILVSTFAGIYLIQHHRSPPPRAVIISTVSGAIGLVVFFYQTMSGGFYAYRILETMSAFLPVVLAWVWRNSGSRNWKLGVLTLTLLGLIIAPRIWGSRII